MNKKQHLCPFCDRNLLQHINQQEVYWFCSKCRQSAPSLDNHQLQIKTF